MGPARWLPGFSGYRIAVAALAGLAMTITVAWWCQLRTRIVAQDVITGPDPRLTVPARVSGQWGVASVRQEGGGVGRTNLRYRSTVSPWGAAAWEVLLSQSGWPMRALELEVRDQGVPRPVGASTEEYRWAWIVPDRGFPGAVAGQALPLRPLWIGLFADIAVWGAAFWPLIGGFVVVRGLIRRRQGRCALCGYPTGVSPICTECGAAVRKPRTTPGAVENR